MLDFGVMGLKECRTEFEENRNYFLDLLILDAFVCHLDVVN